MTTKTKKTKAAKPAKKRTPASGPAPMTLLQFKKMIEVLQERKKKTFELSELGIDLIGLNQDQDLHVLLPLTEAVFGKNGADWIDWYVYDRRPEWGKEAATYRGKPVCFDIPSLYSHIMKHGFDT